MKYLVLALLSLFLSQQILAGQASENLAASVRFATISEQDKEKINYEPFAQHLRFLQQTYPLVFERLTVEIINDYSLLIIWQGSDSALKPVLFTAHTDVVPIEPGTEKDWPHPPFAGVIEDGKIFGRGTLDDKVGVISLLEAAESLIQRDFQPQRTLVFGFGHDEEISGLNGAAKISDRLQELGMHFSWMVDEGGFITSDHPILQDRPVAMINVAEKTYLTLTLSTTGEGGHSSMPPRETSIGKLANAIVKIEQNPMPPRLVSPVTDMLENLAPHLDFPESFVFSNLWLTGPLVINTMEKDRTSNAFVRNTTAVTMFNAGVKENVVPQRAEAKVNFRLLPGETPQQLIDYISELVNDDSITIDHDDWNNPPPISAMEGGGYAVIEQAIKQVYPDSVVVPSMIMATTDTRHYIDVADDIYRFHGSMMSVEQASGIHGTNEWISVESFENTVRVAVEMLRLASK